MKRYFLLIFVVQFVSCVSKKNIIPFQYDRINLEEVDNNFSTVFKADDLLQIIITARDIESVRPFNLFGTNFTVAGAPIGQPQLQNYLVDSNGFIDFPILGRIKVIGKSKEELIKIIKDKIEPDYVKNPTINIFITNFRITVTGDVARPGVFNIPNERITILEAIGMAGDLNITARRDNIKVIREVDGKKKIYEANLLTKNIFTSPVYYLQQNDVIFVEPNNAKSQTAAYNPNTGLFLSLTSIIIAALNLIIR